MFCLLFCSYNNEMSCEIKPKTKRQYIVKKKAKENPYENAPAHSSMAISIPKPVIPNPNPDKMKLLIVESPAKCKKIESYLGAGYKCIASFGHIREIKNGLKDVNLDNNFEPTFTAMSEKAAQITKIRTAIKECGGYENVYLASDDDREGEAIAWHICDAFRLPINSTKRITFNEITASALKHAVANPRTINMELVHAQHARQVLDLLVGYKVSPILWNYISHTFENGLSAGRCQTPALRLVYENNKDIERSPGNVAYVTTGYFTSMTLPFVLNHEFTDTNEMRCFLDDLKTGNYEYALSLAAEPKQSVKKAPSPFTTSTLQQCANNELHFSPKDTMQIAQTLYECGYITYMRTDSTSYSAEFLEKMSVYIQGRWPAVNNEGGIKGTGKGVAASGAHEAIRITDVSCQHLPATYHPRDHRLYYLIWRNTVESCMPDALYKSVVATISLSSSSSSSSSPSSLSSSLKNKNKNQTSTASSAKPKYLHQFKYTAFQLISSGWKLVDETPASIKKTEEDNSQYQYLVSISPQSSVPLHKITARAAYRNTKSHFTEAGLVQMLEKKGIGRPSTFSSLIDKIQERGYVKKQDVCGRSISCVDFEYTPHDTAAPIKETTELREIGNEKNKLVIQPVGVMVVEFLLSHFASLFEYDYTKKMEDELDEITTGNVVWHALCGRCHSEINNLIASLKETGVIKEDVKIDETHTYIIGKHGPVIKCITNPDDPDAGVSFKKVRPDLDYMKLKEGRYTLNEILDTGEIQTDRTKPAGYLGTFQGNDIVYKHGKYGPYLTWGSQNVSLKGVNPLPTTFIQCETFLRNYVGQLKQTSLQQSDAAAVSNGPLSQCPVTQGPILRIVNEDISIRNGKFGDYLYYKTFEMHKPEFISLKTFKHPDGYIKCDEKELYEFVMAQLDAAKTAPKDVKKRWGTRAK